LVSPAFFTDFGNTSYLYIDFPAWERLEKIGYLANCPIPACFGNIQKYYALWEKNRPFYSLLRLYNHAHKISGICWFYNIYKGFMKLYQVTEVSLMLLHMAPEVVRVGPGGYYTQWTMERTIGNLGEEIKQPSNPYANLSQHGIHHSQVNALKAMIPALEPHLDGFPW
jgi:hypothetical protein